MHPTHRLWEWFYNGKDNQILHAADNAYVLVYIRLDGSHRLQSGKLYQWLHLIDHVPACCIPAYILKLSQERELRQEIGPHLASIGFGSASFWELLRSFGGKWMWEDIKKEETNVEWIQDALETGTFVCITAGSYNREKAKTVSSSEWITVCRASHQTLRVCF